MMVFAQNGSTLHRAVHESITFSQGAWNCSLSNCGFICDTIFCMHAQKAMTLLKIAELEIQSVCCLLYSVHGVIASIRYG